MQVEWGSTLGMIRLHLLAGLTSTDITVHILCHVHPPVGLQESALHLPRTRVSSSREVVIRLGLTITQLNRKVNDDNTKIRGKEYKSEKAKVLIARASGLPGVPTLGPACHVTFPIWKSHD